MMRYFKWTLILLLFWGHALLGQNARSDYNWKVGINLGVLAYYGDLTYGFRTTFQELEQLDVYSPSSVAAGAHIEFRASPSWSVQMLGSWGVLAGNDRTVDRQGNLQTENPNFRRSLNFRTEVQDLALLVHFNFDNGKILRRNARFAPYLSAGIGLTHFDVYGDLFARDGSRYYYWSDYSIRNLPEDDPNAETAARLNQDLEFETRLTGLGTERTDGYANWILHIPFGLGAKYRISDRFELAINLVARYAFSDYLDDVSGKYRSSYDNELQAYAGNPAGQDLKTHPYRGNPNGANDWYGFASLSVSYHFGLKLRRFKAPVLMVSQEIWEQPDAKQTGEQTEPAESQEKGEEEKNKPEPEVSSNQTGKPDVDVPEMGIPSDELSSRALYPDTVQVDISQVQGSLHEQMIQLQSEMLAIQRKLDSLEQSTPAKTSSSDTVRIASRSLDSNPAYPEELSSRIEQLGIQLGTIQAQNEAILAQRQESEEPREAEAVASPDYDAQFEALRREIASLDRGSRSSPPATELAAMNQKINSMDAKLTALLAGTATAGIVGGIAGAGKNKKLRKEVEALNTEIALLRTQLAVVPVTPPGSDSLADVDSLQVAADSLSGATPDSLQLLSQPELDQQTLILQQLNEKVLLLTIKLDSLQQFEQPDTVFIPSGESALDQGLDSLLGRPEIAGIQKANIYFKRGSSEVHPTDQLTLNALAAQLLKYPGLRLSISGYADNLTGTPQRNQALSEKRAQSVEQYLLRKGVKPSQMMVQAFGDRVPVYGGVLDRRVELELLLNE